MGTQEDARRTMDPSRLLTIPNALSALRLAGVPVFLWLVLGPRADLLALAVLAVSAATDWLDGKLARAWNQTSRIGRILDPSADRLYIVAILAGLTLREIVPWWFAALIVARELLLGASLPVLYLHGHGPLRVHFLGKAATLCLLYAFPLLFLGSQGGRVGDVALIVGWGFAIWGTALYWCAAVLYLVQVGQVTLAARRERREGGDGVRAHTLARTEGRAAVIPRGVASGGERPPGRPEAAPYGEDRYGRPQEGRPV